MKLPLEFYLRNDVVEVSQDLLGKILCSNQNGRITKAIITETEAYAGIDDKASHAYGGRRTNRTEPLFGQGGTAYIYLCYGIHHLFNVVVGDVHVPLAILIRAAEPIEGIDIMRQRRNKPGTGKILLAGPGTLSQALGITTELTGASLLEDRIWIEDQQIPVRQQAIRVGPRIGIDYAGEDAMRPYRFRITAT
ncbi:MAG: DNA-3-methyladenine glycosylase [Gammaproteobacteria bacterium]|nr:DNA-3-methyladenine glycosylase [Gammaproteobacteria bacterium]